MSLLLVASTMACHAQGSCSDALVRSAHSSIGSEYLDWRLASFVSENEYDEIKRAGRASAVIYGVPVGASYSDFQKRVNERTASYGESLTRDQAAGM
jgi:hypothetical protein